jgi:2-polyprenyl-6-methoxyphenol hydroxylase-like FAD-dependent oxidoreductase
MKIIIVGAGIAGLSTYLFLRKYCKDTTPLDIIIYESHDPSKKLDPANMTFGELSESATAVIGGGIGLMPNGMRVLEALDEKIHDKARDGGFVCEKFVFRSARGWRLSTSPCGDQRGKPGFPPGKEEFCVSMARHTVWKALIDEVEKDRIVYKKVVSVQKADSGSGKKASVTFENGDVEEADLIIGADGVKSKVRKGIFGDEAAIEPLYE